MGDFLVYEQCFKLWPSELFNILDSIHANSRLKDVEKTMDMTSAEFVDNSQVQPFKDGPRGGMWNVLVCFGNGTRMSKRYCLVNKKNIKKNYADVNTNC